MKLNITTKEDLKREVAKRSTDVYEIIKLDINEENKPSDVLSLWLCITMAIRLTLLDTFSKNPKELLPLIHKQECDYQNEASHE